MNVGQLLPFISGYRKVSGEAKTSQGKINAFLRKANEDLRKVIEDSTPALFYLDTDIYLQAIQDFIDDLKIPTSSSRQYIAYVTAKTTDGQEYSVFKDVAEFEKIFQDALAKYKLPVFNISDLSAKIASKQHDLQDFSAPLTRTFDLVNKEVARYASDIAAGNSIAQGKLRYAVTAAGKKTRMEFSKLTPCRLLNPQSIVTGFNPSTQNLFLGISFSTLRDAVNSKITPLIIKSFIDAGINLADKSTEKPKDKKVILPPSAINKKFTIGEIVVFGHTGAKYTDPETAVTEVLGFITPWVQQLMLLAAQNSAPTNTDIVKEFINNSGQIDYSIQFTKEASESVRTLMRGQLAVIVPMSAKLNKKVLDGETKAVDQIIKTIFGPQATYRTVRASLIANVLEAANLKRLFTGLKFSPTLLESITERLVSTIKTGKFKNTPRVTSPLAKQTIVSNTVVKNSIKKLVSKAKLPKATTKLKNRGSISQKVAGTTLNLTNLQNLLNARLVQQVKDNMGRGNRTDVLNLQTGRFAESVKVERISESRAGMITAFYRYMKNPYATFSTGGKQQDPKTRDPKLLIAKSIRELAQQQVANRLRAVVI